VLKGGSAPCKYRLQALKAAGASGAEILAAVTAGSATFAGKTEFSQEKYRKRKARKYLTFASLQRPSARAICEVR
jgi:tRNA (adenine58-N1)-methyltransferase non-catalytic subunit